MSANLSLVSHSAKGHPVKLSAERPRYGFAERSLPDPGRSYKTEDGAFHLGVEFSYPEVFQYPFFYLFEPIVVFVKDLFRFFQLQVVFRALGPGQLNHPVDISSYCPCLSAVLVHFIKAVDLFNRFFFNLFRHLCFDYFFAQFKDLFCFLVNLSQLFLYRLELFPEEIFALGFVYFTFDIGLDFLLDKQELHFPAEDFTDFRQS